MKVYLTIKQHDAFRNLLMGFEIPFRAYIADIITKAFTVDTDFEVAMTTKNQQITASSPTFLRETLGKAVRHNTLRQTAFRSCKKHTRSDRHQGSASG